MGMWVKWCNRADEPTNRPTDRPYARNCERSSRKSHEAQSRELFHCCLRRGQQPNGHRHCHNSAARCIGLCPKGVARTLVWHIYQKMTSKLTCRNYVEHTRLLLFANSIAGRAQQCAVIKLVHWGIGHDWRWCANTGDMTRRHIYALSWIIKCPFEFYLRRVGVDTTFNLGILLLGNSIYARLIWCTSRCICEKPKE